MNHVNYGKINLQCFYVFSYFFDNFFLYIKCLKIHETSIIKKMKKKKQKRSDNMVVIDTKIYQKK